MVGSQIPEVSIIVPNYNHFPYLPERLYSIFNQTHQSFEVILLDDASCDNSSEILKAYASNPKVSHCILNSRNSGNTFTQWNKGLLLTKGKYVWIAESDDYCENDFLERMLQFLNENKDLPLLFCQSHRIDSNGKITGNWLSHTSEFKPNVFADDFIMDGNLFIEKFLIHKNVIPNVSAVVFKREFLERILPLEFEPSLKYIGDWYYYIQLICNSRVGFIAEPLNYFRHHDSSVIAKAGKGKHRMETVKMELLGRRKMMRYISTRKPINFKKIKKEWKKRNETLRYEIIINDLKKGNIFKFGFHFILNPKFARKFIRYQLRIMKI